MYVYTFLILQFIMTNMLFQTVQVKYMYLIHKKILHSLTVISPFSVHEMDREKDKTLSGSEATPPRRRWRRRRSRRCLPTYACTRQLPIIKEWGTTSFPPSLPPSMPELLLHRTKGCPVPLLPHTSLSMLSSSYFSFPIRFLPLSLSGSTKGCK